MGLDHKKKSGNYYKPDKRFYCLDEKVLCTLSVLGGEYQP